VCKIQTKSNQHLKCLLVLATAVLLLFLPAAVFAADDVVESSDSETSSDISSSVDNQESSDSGQSSADSTDGKIFEQAELPDQQSTDQEMGDTSGIEDSSGTTRTDETTEVKSSEVVPDSDALDEAGEDDDSNEGTPEGSKPDKTDSDEEQLDTRDAAESENNSENKQEREQDIALNGEEQATQTEGGSIEVINNEGNSYIAEITPDTLVDGTDTGKLTDFTITFTELSTITKLGSATLSIPEGFEPVDYSMSITGTTDGKAWSGSLMDRVLSLWAENQESYLGFNESVSASFTATSPDEGGRGVYEFETEAWTEANPDHDGTANDDSKVNNMAKGYSDPVVVVGKKVASEGDLDNVRNNLDDYYVQTEDINLIDYGDGEGWESIGDDVNPFTGVYHGNQKTINNLTINRPDEDYIGLFGYNTGTISNLSLSEVDIIGRFFVGGLSGRSEGVIDSVNVVGQVAGVSAVGGLIGGSGPEVEYEPDGSSSYSYSSDEFFGVVFDSHSDVNVSGNSCVGGLIGGTYGEVISSSASGATIVSSENYSHSFELWDHEVYNIFHNGFGGLVGFIGGYGLVEDSYATGNVNGQIAVGGLVGTVDGVGWLHSLPEANIKNSYATGNVSSYFDEAWFYAYNSVGGLIGRNSLGYISDSYATGNVSGDMILGGLVGYNTGVIINSYAAGSVTGDSEIAGGLVGYNADTIINSYYDSTVSGQSDTGKGIGCSTNEMMQGVPSNEIYDGWDNAIWTFSTDNYPQLGADPNPPEPQTPRTHNFSEGDGSEANPYFINCADDLIAVNYYPDAHFLQTGNINLMGIEWLPIGNKVTPFTGKFDGDGYEISGLTINEPNLNYGGLFGYVDKTVELNNINLSDIDITGNNYIGGLAGFLYGEFYGVYMPPIYTIDGEKYWHDGESFVPYDPENEHEWTINCDMSAVNNSHSSGHVTGNHNVGGLVGYGSGINLGGIGLIPLTEVNNSSSSVNVEGYRDVGGLIGYSDGAINNSHVSGDVTGLSSVNNYKGFDWYELSSSIGGLIGYSGGTVDNSYATGNVSGFSNIGGLIGSASDKVSNSYSTGEVTGYEQVGGLVGQISGESVIDNCYAEGDITGSVAANISPYYNDDRPGQLYGSGYHQGSGSIGGLIGRNHGQIIDSHASGSIIGITGVGGLVGVNLGHIDNSYAIGKTHGEWGVGGLVGINWLGTVQNCYATGTVTGERYIDQLIGYDYGFTYATGPSIDVGFMDFVVPVSTILEHTPQTLVNQTVPLLREIISTGFVTNGNVVDLLSAKQALGNVIQQYVAVKGSLSPTEIALVETTIAVAWAAIQALEISFQVEAGQIIDLSLLTQAYQDALEILEMHRVNLTAEDIAYVTAILSKIEALINSLETR
jgi:hypothetical protein